MVEPWLDLGPLDYVSLLSCFFGKDWKLDHWGYQVIDQMGLVLPYFQTISMDMWIGQESDYLVGSWSHSLRRMSGSVCQECHQPRILPFSADFGPSLKALLKQEKHSISFFNIMTVLQCSGTSISTTTCFPLNAKHRAMSLSFVVLASGFVHSRTGHHKHFHQSFPNSKGEGKGNSLDSCL